MRILPLSVAMALAVGAPARADEAGGYVKSPPPVTGEQVYRQVCAGCHMQDGMGGSGAGTIPALAANPRLSAAAYPIILVVKGRGAMPALTDLLSPKQTAEVITYIRTNFGNSYAQPVTEAEVKALMGVPAHDSH